LGETNEISVTEGGGQVVKKKGRKKELHLWSRSKVKKVFGRGVSKDKSASKGNLPYMVLDNVGGKTRAVIGSGERDA